MNRGMNFITGAVAAALTFATLTLTLGERSHSQWGHRDGYWQGHHHHSGSCTPDGKENKEAPDAGDQKNGL